MAAHLIRRISGRAPIWLLRLMGNLWPPYLGAGIKITHGTSDFRSITVILKRGWFNRNYVGTQFGGSIYAMTDPFYMMMIMNNLGRDYIVWDKAAKIDFIAPGRSRLKAEFRIAEDLLDEIRSKTATGEKYLVDLPVEVRDEEGTLVATVEKTIYVRRKRREASAAAS